MNKEIHFFDLDNTLWQLDTKIWIIDKKNPGKPIIKLSGHEMFMIQNGLYKNDNICIDYNNKQYFISKDLLNRINKRRRFSVDQLGVSMVEIFDEERLNETPIKFLVNNILHLQDKDVDIALLTGRHNRERYQVLLNKLRKYLKDIDLSIFKIYFVGDRLDIRHSSMISLKKSEVILEHLIGMKIEDGKFIPLQQDQYNIVHFYDDNQENIEYANDIQLIFDRVLRNSNDELFEYASKSVKNNNLELHNHLVTSNSLNRFKNTTVSLTEPIKFPIKLEQNLIKSYNNFIKG